MMTRSDVEKDYTVDINGTVRSPGKFEGEHWSTVALWDAALDGAADRTVMDGDTEMSCFRLDEEIALLISGPGRVHAPADPSVYVCVWERSDGFVFVDTIDESTLDAIENPPMRIRISSSDDDDGSVLVECDDQEACRNDQSIEGSRWETPRDMDIGYASILDRKGLVAHLQAEGYEVDDSDYSEPTDEDLAYWSYKCDAENAGERPLDRDAWLASKREP